MWIRKDIFNLTIEHIYIYCYVKSNYLFTDVLVIQEEHRLLCSLILVCHACAFLHACVFHLCPCVFLPCPYAFLLCPCAFLLYPYVYLLCPCVYLLCPCVYLLYPCVSYHVLHAFFLPFFFLFQSF